MSVFVARQPIFDRKVNVHGYELLFRSGLENVYDSSDPDKSTLDVIANSFFVIGFDDLTGGKRAFINFTRNLLTQDVASLLPNDRVTMEILEDIEPDEEVLRRCRELKDAGYTLAMDDFVLDHMGSPFVELADIVKVDFAGTSVEDRSAICRDLSAKGVTMLAEKVETMDEFKLAVEWGYSYFQGYFFSKPVVRSGQPISGSQMAYMRALNEVSRPGISYDELEAVIKQDVSLTYKLLRFMNSAWFALKVKVESIRHALVLLGPKEIKKWFALVALRHMASDKPQELIIRSMTRARVGEAMGPMVGLGDHSGDLFLMGMFSFIDALTDAPMADALAKLPLSDQIKDALLGKPSRFRTVHDTVESYEKGQWDEFSSRAAELGLDEDLMPALVNDSVKWANETFATI